MPILYITIFPNNNHSVKVKSKKETRKVLKKFKLGAKVKKRMGTIYCQNGIYKIK